MTRLAPVLALTLLASSATVFARQEARPAAPAAQAAEAVTPRAAGRAVNVRMEFTLTEMTGDETPRTKTVTMIAADRTFGQIRAQTPLNGQVGVVLNVDARPTLLDDGRIRVEMTLRHTPGGQQLQADGRPTELAESLTVILRDGQAMQVSQSAEPLMNRQVTLQVLAAVLK